MRKLFVFYIFRRGFSRNPNAYGPLTDNRDFSYVDGRPVPIGVGQSERVLKHRKYAVI
jgi:Mitoribosomal protein mL52